MINYVPGQKRRRSLFSTFLSLVDSSYSITALLLKLTYSLTKKIGWKFFCHKIIFLSSLIGKFHINFTVDNVFEIIVSTKKSSMIVSMIFLFTPGVNHLVSTKNSQRKASGAFQLMIYNVLIDFFFCK